MLTVLITFSQTGSACFGFCHTGVWLCWGSYHIKSAHKIEKAASETRKNLELYEADLKGVTFTVSYLS